MDFLGVLRHAGAATQPDLDVEGLARVIVPSRRPDPLGEVVHFDKALPMGTSLELRARSDGVETFYVVPSAAAAANLAGDLTLPVGYSAQQAQDRIEVLDASGAVIGRWGGVEAFDASPHQADTAVSVKLQSVQGSRVTAWTLAGWRTPSASIQ